MLAAALTCTSFYGTSALAEEIEMTESTGLSTAAGIAVNLFTLLIRSLAETQEDAVTQDGEDSAELLSADVLEDGVYDAYFDTDSGMFHVNEACEGLGVLTVENGEMTIHISLVYKNIVNLFPGSAEDAMKDGAEWLQPTEDEVTYSDGWTETVYGFDVPVPALDEEFDLALLGKKGSWYDHKVSVSLAE